MSTRNVITVTAVAALAAGGITVAVSAGGLKQAPPGNLSVTPSSATAGSAGNNLTLRMTAKQSLPAGTTVTFNRAPGWSPFQGADKAVAGYVSLAKGTCGTSALSSVAPNSVVVTAACAKSSQYVQISYLNATAPTGAGTSTFTAVVSTAPAVSMPASVAVMPGPVASLAWLQHTSDIVSEQYMTPSPQVLARDYNGNNVSPTGVTLTLGSAPGASLSGTATRTTVNGVATFPSLTVAKAGIGYTLTASAGGAPPVTDALSFRVYPGVPAHLSLAVSPGSINADGLMQAAAVATVTDADFNATNAASLTIAPDVTNDVTVGATTNNNDGTYSATVTGSVTKGANTIIATCSTGCGSITTTSAPLAELAAGNWTNYGSDGRIFANWGTSVFGTSDPPVDYSVLPASITYGVTGALGYFWHTAEALDPDAIPAPATGLDAYPSAWYSDTDMFVTLTFDSTQAGNHVLRLYAADYDNLGRSESLFVSDGSGVLGGVSLAGFQHGAWFTQGFTVPSTGGVVTIQVHNNLGIGVLNAVLSDVLVD
jgi:hypothetical protein